MNKHNFLSLLIIFSIFISLKSYAVPYPERIEWRAEPNAFVISLYKAIFDQVSQDQNTINSLAARINSKPASRLKLFWLFINSEEYKNTMYGKQIREYQVYFEYVDSGNSVKNKYYFAKQPLGADIRVDGDYNYGIAASVRDYYATYDEKSIEYGQLTSLVEFDLFDNEDDSNSMTDYSGRSYKTVKIGTQVWMAENLAYEISGKQIDTNDKVGWSKNIANDGWCYHDKNNRHLGILYQWESAKIACPTGWHLPTYEEWNTLIKYLIVNGHNCDGTTSGDKTAKAMAAKINWKPSAIIGTPGNDQLSNNSSGFSALATGERGSWGYYIPPVGGYCSWWSSTESNTSEEAWMRGLGHTTSSVYRDEYSKDKGFCVRCVKD